MGLSDEGDGMTFLCEIKQISLLGLWDFSDSHVRAMATLLTALAMMKATDHSTPLRADKGGKKRLIKPDGPSKRKTDIVDRDSSRVNKINKTKKKPSCCVKRSMPEQNISGVSQRCHQSCGTPISLFDHNRPPFPQSPLFSVARTAPPPTNSFPRLRHFYAPATRNKNMRAKKQNSDPTR